LRNRTAIVSAARYRPPHRIRHGVPIAAVALALALAACTSTTGPATGKPSAAAVSTDATGQSAARPFCVGPEEGHYVQAAQPGGMTPVLVLGSGPRGVVLGAQANGGICQMLSFARELVSKGYHVAVFDWTEPYGRAMEAAGRQLVADGATKIVLGGFSRGALVALGVAASAGFRPVGVFSVSGGPSTTEGFPTIASLSGYPGPVLLISSNDDGVFPSGTGADLAAAHTGPKTVLQLPGSAHALGLLYGPNEAKVRAAIDTFLAQQLPLDGN